MPASFRPLMAGCLLVCLLASAPAWAADSGGTAATVLPKPVIAVIDVQRILQESLAAQSVQKQLEMQRAHFQTETDKEENELRQAEQDLNKERDHLAPTDYTDREQQLNQRFLAVENHVQSRRRVLDQAFSDSMNAVRDNLLRIVQTVAGERGANLVLVKQQALWMDKAFDVTDEVLNRLNRQLPQVAVKMAPEEEPPAKAK
jgi:Skp family chaperone for outer membrane proteins